LTEIKAPRSRFGHSSWQQPGASSVKTAVLQAIGETALQRGAEIRAALAANDRVKYSLSLLQMALTQADHPEQPPVSLARERIACGIEDAALDTVVATTRREGECYRVPGVAQLLARIGREMRVMAAPVIAVHGANSELARRLQTTLATIPNPIDDQIGRAAVATMTRVGGNGSDSVHQLVMDLHKALNALALEYAEETLAGASVYGLTAEDRPIVQAFMVGVNRTAPLKFDHPGLSCTATRSAGRLLIQNDLGTTDAHVIVIHVEGLHATLTYTDVHPERARFLRKMLSRFPVSWSGERTEHKAGLAEGEAFTLMTGRLLAKDEA
jgi:hypothetical protein